ncbi:isochorismatase family protein [Curtobacterium aurantiacum]|uniref:Isochorismatase family protein n=1 Tax=Curtobacterium aurantiacum TaxID=3236919 RepID=A0ABS5VEE7_9MICO|nr:isochorismatase family protein [Curtobacterium flaccumfaciens]MBT1544679.1 isochorismatase family protein [Curtobacterium flaccumfaciens pv. flaccumfaciens]MBT1587869.1 isochorismatase family protein [Curtobacterium flaccumfaciens pv. flaccumfaciens]MBT1681018.1 isochorismatase family protein [Curtobacterium flaccumfaciens pv. flaccumfaciens]
MTDPQRALVLVDIQLEYFSGPLEVRFPPVDDSLAQITTAIDAATASGTPIVVVQHSAGDAAPVFNPTTDAFALHPEIERRRTPAWKHITKQYSSVFADTDLLPWLREHSVDTVTLVGYMTNNCIIVSAAEAEALGVAIEVLSDATGAINIVNAGGAVDAETVHRTLMAVLQSNLAAVTTTAEWASALTAGVTIPKDALPTSAAAGAQRFPG